MGLKPKRAYLSSISISVMEHESLLNTNSKMLLKDDSQSFPNGSPQLNDVPLLKPGTVVNGSFLLNNGHGRHEGEIIPATVPLQVEINGYRLAHDTGSHSPLSSNLPTPLPEHATSKMSDYSVANQVTDAPPEIMETGSQSFSAFAVQPTYLKNSDSPVAVSQSKTFSAGVHRSEEKLKKKCLMDKITQFQSSGTFKFLVPQCDIVPASQLAVLARKMKGNGSGLPKTIRNQIFDDQDLSFSSPPLETVPGDFDEKTDVSDLEMDQAESLSSKVVHWTSKKVRIECSDSRLRNEIESKRALLDTMERQFYVDGSSRILFEELSVDSCARSRSVSDWKHRRTIRHSFRVAAAASIQHEPVDYTQMQPSTSKDAIRDLNNFKKLEYSEETSIERRMQAYLHLISMVPSTAIRKRVDRPVWLNAKEIDEEQQRNGWTRTAERERRKHRERASGAGDDSSDYQDTDESDDEYVPKNLPISRQSGYKRKRGRPPKDGRDPPLPLAKIGRRHSVATSYRARQYEVDEYLPECGTAHLPQKIDYKEIVIPNWHEHGEVYEEPSDPSTCQTCSSDLFLTVAQSHHIQEFHEKRRFQAYRDRAARDKAERESSVVGSDPPSGQHTPQPIIVPPFDPSSITQFVPLKSSLAKPYSPRSFSEL